MTYKELRDQTVVPEDIRAIIKQQCINWDNGYGYPEKKYLENQEYQCQLNLNASLSETQTQELLNDPDVVAEINSLLSAHNIGIQLSGNYQHNELRHGEISSEFARVDDRTWCDFIRKSDEYDKKAAWTVEAKATGYPDKLPQGVHRADVVLQFCLSDKSIEVLATTLPRKDRTDADYIRCGKLTETLNFKPARISKTTWRISDF